jgi:hypothetical protein
MVAARRMAVGTARRKVGEHDSPYPNGYAGLYTGPLLP